MCRVNLGLLLVLAITNLVSPALREYCESFAASKVLTVSDFSSASASLREKIAAARRVFSKLNGIATTVLKDRTVRQRTQC